MKTRIIAFICIGLFMASTMPSTAAESHKANKAVRGNSDPSETFRRSNAYLPSSNFEAPARSNSQLNGALSAPAGR